MAVRPGTLALATAVLLGLAVPVLAQSTTSTLSTTGTTSTSPSTIATTTTGPPPGAPPEATSGAIPVPTSSATVSPTSTVTTTAGTNTASTTTPVVTGLAPGPNASFAADTSATGIMSLVAPPSLNLSSLLPSTAAATTPGGNTLPRDVSNAGAPHDVLICPPGEAAAEQVLLVGSGISCAP